MRGKKLDPENREKLFRMVAQGYGPNYISQHLGIHKSTVVRYKALAAKERALASAVFQRHSEDLSSGLRQLVSSNRSGVGRAALAHFRQAFPEYTQVGIPEEVLQKMELLADTHDFDLCPECPVCQIIMHSTNHRPTFSSDGRKRRDVTGKTLQESVASHEKANQ